jgi:hypothetical protein
MGIIKSHSTCIVKNYLVIAEVVIQTMMLCQLIYDIHYLHNMQTGKISLTKLLVP